MTDMSIPGLTLKQLRAVNAAFGLQPPEWREQLWVQLATLLGTGPWSDKQIHDAIIETVAPDGGYVPTELGLEFWTGPDIVPVLAGTGTMSAALAPQYMSIFAGLSGSGGLRSEPG
jgi:hypothetical protein